MTTADDADGGSGATRSIEDVARAAAVWLRHERVQFGRHYVAVPELEHAATSAALPAGDPPAPTIAVEESRARRVADDEQPRTSSSTLRRASVADPLREEGARARAETGPTKLPVLDTPHAKLEYLRTRNVGDCQRCGLASTRRHLVFGVGDPEAKVMFVGEAPGAEEDERGEPFVGAAGRRLDQWLADLGIARSSVYIANVLKCRPPRNRDPEPVEIAKCSPFLHAQIRAIQPRVLVALGRFAAQQLLGRDASLASMRGEGREYVEPKSGARIPVVVTYHPSYVLRRESEPSGSQGDASRKSENDVVLEDLRLALGYVERG